MPKHGYGVQISHRLFQMFHIYDHHRLWTGKEQYALAILVAHLVLFIMTVADSISRRL